jgi:hypothetical protein
MSLPPPQELTKLHQICNKSFWSQRGSYGDSDAVKDWLTKYLKVALATGIQTGIQRGVTAAAGGAVTVAGTAGLAAALFPLGSALAPWLGALGIVLAANGIFRLYNLKEAATRQDGYYCSCGKCATGLQYVINKKENNVAILAVSIFTGGLPLIADKINSIRKSFQSNRPKEQHCRQFVTSAKGGCLCAIAAIMMLCGEWKNQEAPDKELIIEAIAIMVSENGWRKLKAKW